MKVIVLEIDLRAPGIRFKVTPPNGKLPGETTLQTTRDFLVEQHAQLAINASFYKIIEKQYGDSEGYTASEGQTYSGPSTRPSGSPSLNISKDNVATIVDHRAGSPEPSASELFNTVSGNERIIRSGKNVAKDARFHPRMAAGIRDAGHTLVIIEVDGRQPRISEGATTIEMANFLLEYDVTEAVNLDGGGSATMAIADPSPRILNTPVGIKDIPGSQRKNACNLAIFAAPR
jgi:exopolysaccharide biosynthesis protein